MRGGLLTWALVAAVGALAAAAVVDALRSPPGPAATETTAALEPPPGLEAAARALEAAGASGTLLYLDRACRVRALALPSLAPAAAPSVRGCDVTLAADGAVSSGGVRGSPNGVLLAACRDGAVEAVSAGGALLARFEGGCRPAWRSDGALTWVEDGGVVRATHDCPGDPRASPPVCSRAVLRQRDLAGALGDVSWAVRAVAWLGAARMAALAERDGLEKRVVLAENGDVLASVRVAARTYGLEASPRGRYVAVTRGPAGVSVFDADGGHVPIPGIGIARALAWSPDERLAALATVESIYIFPFGRAEPLARIPVAARDLAWRRG